MIYKRVGVALCAALLLPAGCGTRKSPEQQDQQLQQQAARATENAKKDARIAAADAKVAAANAERKVNAIAAGVKEGWKNGKPAAGRAAPVNVNSASESQLVLLPGISQARARRIIRGRPYSSPQNLVEKGVLTQAQLDRISDQVTVQ